MFQCEVLVGESIAIEDVYDASSVVVNEITSLDHEVLDDSVEAGAFVATKFDCFN